jgi:KDO2-lipid IV(A) lauroyltransferase
MREVWLRLRHRLEATLVFGLYRLVNILPTRLLFPFIECLSDLFFAVVRIRRRIVFENLRRAFREEKDEKEIRRIARAVYRNFAKTVVEICRLPALIEQVELLDRLIVVEGFDIVRAALKEQKGVILLSGHLGSWEVGAAVVAQRLGGLKVVAAPMTNRVVDDFLNRCRRRVSIEPIPPGMAIKEIVKALRNGEAVGFLADQDAGRQGVFVEFFGRPASTAPGPAVIAIRRGIPIVFCFSIREAEGRHRILFERAIAPDSTWKDTSEMMIRWVMQEYTRRLERFVRIYPEQWLWLHRRWKTQREQTLER